MIFSYFFFTSIFTFFFLIFQYTTHYISFFFFLNFFLWFIFFFLSWCSYFSPLKFPMWINLCRHFNLSALISLKAAITSDDKNCWTLQATRIITKLFLFMNAYASQFSFFQAFFTPEILHFFWSILNFAFENWNIYHN